MNAFSFAMPMAGTAAATEVEALTGKVKIEGGARTRIPRLGKALHAPNVPSGYH
jgi:hypothetical protein